MGATRRGAKKANKYIRNQETAATVHATGGQGGESHDMCIGTSGPLTLEGICSKLSFYRSICKERDMSYPRLPREVKAEPGLEPVPLGLHLGSLCSTFPCLSYTVFSF